MGGEAFSVASLTQKVVRSLQHFSCLSAKVRATERIVTALRSQDGKQYVMWYFQGL